MAVTVDNITLPAAFADMITTWGWRAMVEHFGLWSGGTEAVKESQVMEFFATMTNPIQGDNADDFMEFYNGRFGSAYGFLLELPDLHPYSSRTGEFLGNGDGVEDTFQARMNIGDATRPTYHNVTRLKAASTTVYVGASEDSGATVDIDTGLITLSGGVVAGSSGQSITADFVPLMVVRFASEELAYPHSGNEIYSPNIGLIGINE